VKAQAHLQKKTRTKWIGGMPQVVEHLLCNHETLSSNPSPIKQKMFPLFNGEEAVDTQRQTHCNTTTSLFYEHTNTNKFYQTSKRKGTFTMLHCQERTS
jgi:hypothetical protein